MDTYLLLQIIVRLDSYMLFEDVITGRHKGFHVETVYKEIRTDLSSNHNGSL